MIFISTCNLCVVSTLSFQSDPKDQATRSLRGVMRVGLVAKGLLLKGDLDLELVLLCKEKPNTNLLKKVSDNLLAQLKVSGLTVHKKKVIMFIRVRLVIHFGHDSFFKFFISNISTPFGKHHSWNACIHICPNGQSQTKHSRCEYSLPHTHVTHALQHTMVSKHQKGRRLFVNM